MTMRAPTQPSRTEQHDRYPLATVARLTGLSPDVIRAWERRYQAVRPERGPRGARIYRTTDIDRLRLLGAVVRSGRSIGDVAQLGEQELRSLLSAVVSADEVPTGKVSVVPDPLRNAVIRDVIDAAREYDQVRVRARLGEALLALGGVEFAKRVLAPLLHEVGERWTRGNFSVSHEHFLSGILRHFIAELVHARHIEKEARVVLATPMGEQHEFGILLASLILCDQGIAVRYLGPNTPAEDILRAATTGVAVIGLSVVSSDNRPLAISAIREILELASPTLAIWLGGRDAQAVATAVRHSRVHVVQDLEELAQRASKLWSMPASPTAP